MKMLVFDPVVRRVSSSKLVEIGHGPPRGWLAAALFASAVAAGCSTQQPDDQQSLEAILNDGDLSQMSIHGLTAAPAAGGRGGNAFPGTGGAAGFAPPPDGGVGDGPIGGFNGSGGFFGSGGFTGSGGFFGSGGFTGSGGFDGSGGFGGFGGGMGGNQGQFPQGAQGLWFFDDCNPDRTELQDSSFNQHTAFRAVTAACVAGKQNQGIGIDSSDDYVYVPDQPSFTFDNGLTVAAWVKLNKLGDVRTIIRKREDGTSTFVLATNDKNYQMVIKLSNGNAVSVTAKATTNTWTHVAATYDGKDLKLFVNGTLAAKTKAKGQLSTGLGPVLMGNDASGRRIDGTLDGVYFDTFPATDDQIASLNCVPGQSTVSVVPVAGPAVPAGTEVDYDVQITNHDPKACPAKSYQFAAFQSPPGVFPSPVFTQTDPVAPGQTGHLTVSVTTDTALDPDTYTVPFQFSAFDPLGVNNDFVNGNLSYSVLGTPCSVRTREELMITDLSVVEDPVRTVADGPWTFARLMENMAPSAADAPAMVEATLKTWLTDQTVNSFTIPARPAMNDLVLNSFPRRADGQLDLTKAPVRLLAIVNRIDLRDLANGNAGEGRFVFGVLDQFGNQQQFTMIFEFKLPATTTQDVLDWANRWHALDTLPFPSAAYNTALQAITDRFSGRNAAPGRPNGSAISQFRTNEIALSFVWQFREFHLSPTTGRLVPAELALTPDLGFNNTPVLADYINQNQTSILAETHVVPESFEGQPFEVGSVINDLNGWDAPGVDPEARHRFSRNTCNGCHSARETNTIFLQINPRNPGEQTFLSGFLTGTTVFDGTTGQLRNFNDLHRRNVDLHALICPNDPLPGTGGAGGGGTGGIGGARGTGSGGRGGSSGVGGARGTGGISGGGGRSGVSPASVPSSGGGVIDESAAVINRPDFISKGISRAD